MPTQDASVERASKLDTSTISDALDRLGHQRPVPEHQAA